MPPEPASGGVAIRRPPGILTNGCFDQREGVALSSELIWGSYYLPEGLAMLIGRF